MAADLVILALLMLMGKGKDSGAGGKSKAHIATSSELISRATQHRAMAWAPYFQDVGEIPSVSDALSRWAGIESGGDPRIVSTLGERGLLQVGVHTRAEGGISDADWADLVNSDTTPNTDARIASQYANWLFTRAAKHLSNPPSDPTERVWFAYLYHQRPKDFTEWGHLPGSAPSAASALRLHFEGNPYLAKRVNAANIVAYGVPETPNS
jgi:hypothetical protein